MNVFHLTVSISKAPEWELQSYAQNLNNFLAEMDLNTMLVMGGYAPDGVKSIPYPTGAIAVQAAESKFQNLIVFIKDWTNRNEDVEVIIRYGPLRFPIDKNVTINEAEIKSMLNAIKKFSSKTDYREDDLLVDLKNMLVSRFDNGELRSLCFELHIDYEILRGENKAEKVQELIMFLDRRNRLDQLLNVGARIRPDIDWQHIR